LQSELDRVGMDELDAVDRRTVARARKVLWLLTQPLHVYAPFIGLPGVYVTAADTVAGFEALLDGRADDLPEDALIMVGGLDTAIAKARRLDP
ncbi:MAG: F0F1 ATP synthase subunit beta, partial [Myxococcota bacterium]